MRKPAPAFNTPSPAALILVANRRLLGALALLTIAGVLPGIAFALQENKAGVVGKWQATIESPRGANEVVMEFKGSDEELQGTWTGPRGTSELEDVQYTDGKLTFHRTLEMQGNSLRVNYEGVVEGDSLKLKISTPRGEREVTAKRIE